MHDLIQLIDAHPVTPVPVQLVDLAVLAPSVDTRAVAQKMPHTRGRHRNPPKPLADNRHRLRHYDTPQPIDRRASGPSSAEKDRFRDECRRPSIELAVRYQEAAGGEC
jgi:hypothetical protein